MHWVFTSLYVLTKSLMLKPVIFRATPQWFASIDKVRQDILDAIEVTDFKVDWGKTRIFNMIRDRG